MSKRPSGKGGKRLKASQKKKKIYTYFICPICKQRRRYLAILYKYPDSKGRKFNKERKYCSYRCYFKSRRGRKRVGGYIRPKGKTRRCLVGFKLP